VRALAALACTLAAALLAASAAASGVYRWTDAAGVTHYGDRPPEGARPAEVHVVPVRADPGAIARLRVDGEGGRFEAWADNRLAGPIEVMLHFSRRDNFEGAPRLPARAMVEARGSALVSRLGLADPSREGSFELRLDAVPGDPSARPQDVEYAYPLDLPRMRIDQGYGGSFSHGDPQNRHAVDFAAPEGTPVVAARDGVVMQSESGFQAAGLDAEAFGGRANFVRILHEDGTMALYAHLAARGVEVRVGDLVRRGQRIGRSGNTGFTTGPHLHFVVQVNRGMRLVSIPFRLAASAGATGTRPPTRG
jgi:murein DD-endopeptidase MepM/ murein hydrolase activator NlpD